MKKYAISLGLFGARVIKGNKSFGIFILANGFILIGLNMLWGAVVATMYATVMILFMWYSFFIVKRYGK